MSFTLGELAQHVDAQVVGDASCRIDSISTLQNGRFGSLTFLTNSRYRKYLQSTQASAVILNEAELPYCPTNAIVAANPHLAYAKLATLFVPKTAVPDGVHPSASIDPSAIIASSARIAAQCVIGANVKVAAGAVIGPGCVVEHDTVVGQDSHLVANVTVYYGCTIGERCLIHAGAVIGSDGFGFAYDHGSWVKVPQLGGVVIGDDVEIGANTSIDRGAVEDTVIEDGVKLDNQIQVAHNVRIGAHTAMAGCVGVAGSAEIGKHCAIGGGAGILGHLQIADGTTITAMSLVTKSIREPGVYSSGTPLEPSEQWHKNTVRFKHLDAMARKLRQLEREIEQLKERAKS